MNLMEDKYIFNEQRKRIEPKETLCQFCNQKHSEKMDRNYFVPLFKVKDKTELIIYSSVKFNKILIGIPRCNQCFVIHKQKSANAWGISIISAVVLIILGFVFLGIFGWFVLIAIFISAIILPMFLKDFLIQKTGILTEQDGAKKDFLVRDMVISGWSLTAPSPR